MYRILGDFPDGGDLLALEVRYERCTRVGQCCTRVHESLREIASVCGRCIRVRLCCTRDYESLREIASVYERCIRVGQCCTRVHESLREIASVCGRCIRVRLCCTRDYESLREIASVYERCIRVGQCCTRVHERLREATGVDGFGRVMSANVALCMQMSRQVYICRALLAFFRGCCRLFFAFVGLRWESVFGCGRLSGNFLGEV